MGVEVRLMCTENREPGGPQPDYPLKKFNFGPWEPIVQANGFNFAIADKKLMREAIRWADVVHLEDPMLLEMKALSIAKKEGKPCVSTFHIFPQNILWNVWKFYNSYVANYVLQKWWNLMVYNRCADVQCPSKAVYDYLKRMHAHTRLHLISNGTDLSGEPLDLSKEQESPRILACIGRLSKEKSPKTLLKAMKYVRNADKVQLYFAGKGMSQGKLAKKAQKLYDDGVLKHMPVFQFCNPEQLHELRQKAYLYIHCAKIEVEGLSCLEALDDGLVPVIAKSRYVATSQFAIDERSLYKADDAKTLAERIDYWIENPEEHDRMAAEYKNLAQQYDRKDSARQILEMYKQAVVGKKD